MDGVILVVRHNAIVDENVRLLFGYSSQKLCIVYAMRIQDILGHEKYNWHGLFGVFTGAYDTWLCNIVGGRW